MEMCSQFEKLQFSHTRVRVRNLAIGKRETWKHGKRKRKREQGSGSGEGKLKTPPQMTHEMPNMIFLNRKVEPMILCVASLSFNAMLDLQSCL